MYVRYNTANNVSTFSMSGTKTANNVSNFGGDPVTQLIVNVYQNLMIKLLSSDTTNSLAIPA